MAKATLKADSGKEAVAGPELVKSHAYGAKTVKHNTNHVLASRIAPGMQKGDKVKVIAMFDNGDVIVEHLSSQKVFAEGQLVSQQVPVNVRLSAKQFQAHLDGSE